MKLPIIRVYLRVALLYALFGGLWILLSDQLLVAFFTDVSTLTILQTYKGWAFVFFSTLLIFFLLRRDLLIYQIAENKLRESDERLSKIFSVSPVAISIVGVFDGKINEVNDVWCELMGFSKDEAVGHDVEELKIVNHEQRSRIREEFNNSKGSIRLLDSEITTKSGDKKSILTSTELITIKGAPFSINLVIDITKRKRVEEEIRSRSKELASLNAIGQQVSESLSLNAVVSAAVKEIVKVVPTDVVIVFLREGEKLILAGIGPQGAAEKFGKLAEHRIGECMCGLAVRQGKPLYSRDIYTDLRCTWKECKKAGFRSFAALPLRSGTEIVGVMGLAAEVERDLELQAEFLETLASQVASGIRNAQLYEQTRRRLNELDAIHQAAQRLQALRTPESLSQTLIQIFEENLGYEYGAILLLDEENGLLTPFALSDQGQGAEFINMDKAYVASQRVRLGKGITGWVAQTGQSVCLGDVRKDPRYQSLRTDIRSELCVPLRVGDVIIGVVNVETSKPNAYTEDDQRVLETNAAQIAVAIQNARLFEQIQHHAADLERHVAERTAQLLSANKELESFSYSVSHDLRAPLRAISGFSSIIASRHRASLNEEGQHYLDNIVQASEYMGHLIEDLLTYTRLGRTGVRQELVSLASLVDEISRNMQSHLAEIHGTLNIAENLPSVIGDQTLLNRIFTNLLENAFKYHNSDVPPRVSLTCDDDGNNVILRVSDNGIGIPLEHQEKIFNIFQRLHSEEEYPGTGIGLATVRKSVELLGGSVWVESKVDEGSMFFIRLPKE